MVWNDPVCRDFQANQWEPLDGHTRAVIGAMDTGDTVEESEPR